MREVVRLKEKVLKVMLMEGFPDLIERHRKTAKADEEANTGPWKDFGENVLAKPLSPQQGETRACTSSAE